MHGFKLLASRVAPSHRELAMASASVAADVGLMLGSGSAVLLQACIYAANDVDDAEVAVGFCH